MIKPRQPRRSPGPGTGYAVMGAEPQWQGQGLGTALMRPVLERCNDKEIPAYPEATSPRNRALYQRHGFEATRAVFGRAQVADGMAEWRTPNR